MTNNRILLVFMLLLLMLGTACRHRKAIEITNFTHHDIWNATETLKGTDCIEYDSVTFSDGSYAVRQMRYAPQNWLTRFVGKEEQLIATVSAASETYTQRLIYGYDDRGRLKYLLRFDAMREPDMDDETTDSAYLHFRLAIDSADFRQPDTNRHILSEIIYGDDGLVHEVTEKPSGKIIKAPQGYKLQVSVDPCVSFWASDLSGGYFLLKTDIVPVTKNQETYSIKRFVDFIPTTEEYYRHGQRCKIVCHPNPNYNDDVKMTITRRTDQGENIYARVYENSSDTLISTWKDGYLQKEILKSKWGTVLNEKRYYYLPSGKVRREERGFDYKTKTLNSTIVKMMEFSDILPEDEIMDPLQGASWWNVYP